MAFTVVSLGSQADTTARSEHTCTIARAPADNTLVLVSVSMSDTVGTPAQPTAVAGAGLAFDLVGSSITFSPTTPGSQLENLSVWKGVGASLVSSVVSATFANATSGCVMLVTEVSGSTRVGKSVAVAADGTSAITAQAAAAFHPSNAWFTVGSVGDGVQSDSVGLNYTLLDMAVYTTPNNRLSSAWTTLSTGTTAVWSRAASNENRAAIIVEIMDPASMTANTPGWLRTFDAPAPRTFAPRVRSAWVEAGSARNTDPYTDTTEG